MGLLSSDVEAVVIELDKANQPLIVGDTISGSVLVTTQKEGVKVKKITLDITGEIEIEFDKKTKKKSKGKNKKGGSKTVNATLRKNVTFFKQAIILEGEEKELPVGMSKYSFSFELPEDGKSSFQGTHGSIKYLAKAMVDIPWGIDNESQLEIFINKIHDLNDDIETLETADAQQTKTVGCLCFASGPISVNVALNKKGFVCGEQLKINARVLNSSKYRIKEVQISLLQVLTYHAKSGSVSHTKAEINEIIDSLDIGSVEATDEKSFEHFLAVPEVPTTLVEGEAVDIKYQLKVVAVPEQSLPTSDEGCCIPITIGNIPHKVAFSSFETGEKYYTLGSEWRQKYTALPGFAGVRHIEYKLK
eukprot:TRINITY_DN46794_c0_g1_i1.p1 TRINITY_DN46794_c0_g1~~TRINITY_DN46794_c0_g1_i1.p1  ORF type:complete len:383 (+),score=115.83 TRINITY_DN46794_c0_g1_i1:68-1150(+)